VPAGEPRRQFRAQKQRWRVGTLKLDLIDRAAWRGERQIDLRPREFLLLKYMIGADDKVLTEPPS